MKRKKECDSFFNFFCNLKTPNEEEIKKISLNTEREIGKINIKFIYFYYLGGHFDLEYELCIEFIEEIIPYASEYFLGISNDNDEYAEYKMDLMNKKF